MSTGEPTKGLKWRVTKAVRASKLPSSAKLVMFVLADVATAGTAEIPPHRTPSLTVLADETGLGRSTVAEHLRALEAGGWVVRVRPTTAEALGRGERTRYQLRVPESMAAAASELVQELDQEDQEPSAVAGLPSAGDGLPSADAGPPSAVAGHRYRSSSDKNQIEEQTLTSEAEPSDPARPDVEKICQHLADRIVANGSKRPTITKKWRDEGRRLIDLDGKTVEQVIRAIDWCQNHHFWRANVMSMPKLRKNYDRLRLEAQGKAPATNGRSHSTNRHIDQLPPEERAARNPFTSAVHASKIAAGGPS